MKYAELVQKYRVTLGFLVGIGFLLVSRPTTRLFVLGTGVVMLGLAVRFWAAGYLKKAKMLTTAGPYAYTRNPLYLGSFLLLIGFLIAGGNWIVGAGVIVLYILVYVPTMRREEGELRNGFREEYDRYAEQVPLFIPTMTRYAGGDSEWSFCFSRVVQNREYKSLLGSTVGMLLIYLKMRLL